MILNRLQLTWKRCSDLSLIEWYDVEQVHAVWSGIEHWETVESVSSVDGKVEASKAFAGTDCDWRSGCHQLQPAVLPAGGADETGQWHEWVNLHYFLVLLRFSPTRPQGPQKAWFINQIRPCCHFYRATLCVARIALHGLCDRNSARLSVCLSVCHTRALCPHGSTYDRHFFTVW